MSVYVNNISIDINPDTSLKYLVLDISHNIVIYSDKIYVLEKRGDELLSDLGICNESQVITKYDPHYGGECLEAVEKYGMEIVLAWIEIYAEKPDCVDVEEIDECYMGKYNSLKEFLINHYEDGPTIIDGTLVANEHFNYECDLIGDPPHSYRSGRTIEPIEKLSSEEIMERLEYYTQHNNHYFVESPS